MNDTGTPFVSEFVCKRNTNIRELEKHVPCVVSSVQDSVVHLETDIEYNTFMNTNDITS